MVDRIAAPRAQRHLKLTIGADTYETHVSSIKWTPTAETLTWRGGTPDAVHTDRTNPTWATEWAVVQDWETPDSLCNFLLDNDGVQAEVEYKPQHDGDFGITATVTLAAPEIGGPVNAFNESTVTMGSTKPERIPVVP